MYKLSKTDFLKPENKELILQLENQWKELEQELDLTIKFEDVFAPKGEPTFVSVYIKNSETGFYAQFGFDTLLCSKYYYFDECDNEFEHLIKKDKLVEKHDKKCWNQWVEEELKDWAKHTNPWEAIQNGEMKKCYKRKIELILISLGEVWNK